MYLVRQLGTRIGYIRSHVVWLIRMLRHREIRRCQGRIKYTSYATMIQSAQTSRRTILRWRMGWFISRKIRFYVLFWLLVFWLVHEPLRSMLYHCCCKFLLFVLLLRSVMLSWGGWLWVFVWYCFWLVYLLTSPTPFFLKLFVYETNTPAGLLLYLVEDLKHFFLLGSHSKTFGRNSQRSKRNTSNTPVDWLVILCRYVCTILL